jgi:hypothetical protein
VIQDRKCEKIMDIVSPAIKVVLLKSGVCSTKLKVGNFYYGKYAF